MVSPGTDVADALRAGRDRRPRTSASCSAGSPPSGPETVRSTLRSLAAKFAPSMICWMNGLPFTWVTNAILMRSAAGEADVLGAADDGAADDGAADDGAADDAAAEDDGAVVAPPVDEHAATNRAVMAGMAHLWRRFTIPSWSWVDDPGRPVAGRQRVQGREAPPGPGSGSHHGRSVAVRWRRSRCRRTRRSTATATMITAPVTNVLHFTSTPRNRIPVVMTWMMRAPTTVPRIVPRPPDRGCRR